MEQLQIFLFAFELWCSVLWHDCHHDCVGLRDSWIRGILLWFFFASLNDKLQTMWNSNPIRSFQLLFCGMTGLSICLSGSFLAVYQWKLIAKNQATLEDHYKDGPYDMGCLANMEQVCGPGRFQWLCPTRTTTADG